METLIGALFDVIGFFWLLSILVVFVSWVGEIS